VSFNLDAFSSYGKEQGDNAPVSEYAAFAYTTALNHLLRRTADNHQRVQLGDTTLLFWAQGSSAQASQASESFIAAFLNETADTDAQATAKLQSALLLVQAGRPLAELEPSLDDDMPFFVLGLAPNASRLSVRYWFPGTLRQFAVRLADHFWDLKLIPPPRHPLPSLRQLALITTPYRNGKHQSDDMPPLLVGELARAVFSGGRYPQSLLATLLMRLRADGHLSDLRVALIKAVLARNNRLDSSKQQEIPVSLDTQNRDTGYLLGRLFSSLENAQSAALGSNINATIRDRYYGAASATPAIVFPLLLRNTQHHLSRLHKDKPGLAHNLEKEIGGIVDLLPPAFARHLKLEAQGRFAIGYYHQTQQRFLGKAKAEEDASDDNTEQGA
jgi:CRISPR-associated protein Csd1